MMQAATLPVIDLSGFVHGDQPGRKRTADIMVEACETAGFFYLVNHGISESVFQAARDAALEFFRSPSAFKSRYHISRYPHHRGYVGDNDVYPDPENRGDIRQAFKVALELPDDDPDYLSGITMYGPNVWPEGMPEFRRDVYNAYRCFQELAQTIFSLFAVGLGLQDDHFVPLTDKPASVMNLNYYAGRAPDEPGRASGIGAHNDYEAFAMLWQDDVGGLQIESLGGDWEAVDPLAGSLVINIGELMQRWTNDRFRATRHRVVNDSARERVSIACFGNTSYHARIECIASCCSARNPARYKPVMSGEYLMDAVRRTYAYTD